MWSGWSLAPQVRLLPPVPLPVAAHSLPRLLGCLGRSPADAVLRLNERHFVPGMRMRRCGQCTSHRAPDVAPAP
eukprot:8314501-Pyramimonas_sp.AAC.1